MVHALNTMQKKHQEYFTPSWIVGSLGKFDLDPCTTVKRPFDIATHNWCIENIDGLIKNDWFGRVWLNPPYGRDIQNWIKKLCEHNNGIALIFARTETSWFHKYIWGRAHSIFFFRGRVTFLNKDGQLYSANAGAPSCLVSYGRDNTISIKLAKKLKGQLIILRD